jgi:hypothetical protein
MIIKENNGGSKSHAANPSGIEEMMKQREAKRLFISVLLPHRARGGRECALVEKLLHLTYVS